MGNDRPTVLIVTENGEDRAALGDCLFGFYQGMEAGSLAEAQELLKNCPARISMILVDLNSADYPISRRSGRLGGENASGRRGGYFAQTVS